jgi:hypothetical protein
VVIMWTTIYMVTGIDEANNLTDILKKEGFLVKSKFVTNDGEGDLYEILAPEFEAEDIHQVLRELNLF